MTLFCDRYVLKDGTVIKAGEIYQARRESDSDAWWIWRRLNGIRLTEDNHRIDRPTGMVDSTGREIFERDIVEYRRYKGIIKQEYGGEWYIISNEDNYRAFRVLRTFLREITITGMVPFGEEE